MNSMVARAKAVYRVLPPSVRGAAAGAFGWYLRWWRYGGDSEDQVYEALLRESWSEAEWDRYQHARLAVLLERSVTRVPYYREHWRARRAAGDTASWAELKNWPVLSKDALRANPRAFLADDNRSLRLFQLSSSGTSGTPITTWRSRRTMRSWFALFEARTRRWYGVRRQMRWAILGGQLVTPAAQTKPPFWVWNAGLRQLYMSTLHLSPVNVGAYLDAMFRHRVEYMYGYASSMYWLARAAHDQGLAAPRLVVTVSNAESLSPHQRQMIGEVFQCPVRDTYGMSEIVAAGSECNHGVLHSWPDAGIVEVLDESEDTPVPLGASGRLVCTGLLNEDMPLIRYEVGDRGAIGPADGQPCGCGRTLPRLVRVEGRTSDNLITSDGRRVFWINPVFYELPVREAQVVQEAVGRVRVVVVPDEGYDAGVETLIRQRMSQRLGEVDVEVHRVARIERGANGKFQPVVNLVDTDG